MRSRKRILDATLDLIGRNGFEGITIASVAQAAGVTRQTVYANFGTREEVVSQAMVSRLTEVAAEIQRELTSAADPGEYVVELVVACRRAVRSDPVLTALLRSETNNPLFDEDAVTRAKVVAGVLLQPLAELFPDVVDRIDDFAGIAVHLGLSVVCFDDAALRDDDALRAFLFRWLAPGIA
ncbi:TetR/AcrR family transcriptional regulator [Rhodococcus triatomae]|nr:transcriptional regulator [Rhodococcus triatomae BKS 15-14]